MNPSILKTLNRKHEVLFLFEWKSLGEPTTTFQYFSISPWILFCIIRNSFLPLPLLSISTCPTSSQHQETEGTIRTPGDLRGKRFLRSIYNKWFWRRAAPGISDSQAFELVRYWLCARGNCSAFAVGYVCWTESSCRQPGERLLITSKHRAVNPRNPLSILIPFLL